MAKVRARTANSKKRIARRKLKLRADGKVQLGIPTHLNVRRNKVLQESK